MNKPTTLLMEEFKQNMAKLINDSGLPAFVVEYIIKDLYTEISQLAMQVAEQEKAEYVQSLSEENKEDSETE